MIIFDKTTVNYGHHSSVVIKTKKQHLEKPRIGCQHHTSTCDGIFSHLNQNYPTRIISLENILPSYGNFQKKKYHDIETKPERNKSWKWNNFLISSPTFREYAQYNLKAKTRWNSRAIFAVITYFLLSKWEISWKKLVISLQWNGLNCGFPTSFAGRQLTISCRLVVKWLVFYSLLSYLYQLLHVVSQKIIIHYP